MVHDDDRWILWCNKPAEVKRRCGQRRYGTFPCRQIRNICNKDPTLFDGLGPCFGLVQITGSILLRKVLKLVCHRAKNKLCVCLLLQDLVQIVGKLCFHNESFRVASPGIAEMCFRNVSDFELMSFCNLRTQNFGNVCTSVRTFEFFSTFVHG